MASLNENLAAIRPPKLRSQTSQNTNDYNGDSLTMMPEDESLTDWKSLDNMADEIDLRFATYQYKLNDLETLIIEGNLLKN